MIAGIIQWSIHNRVLVLLLTLILVGWGIYAIKNTPLDAIPDLSDAQVIIKTPYPGQAPRVVEDQITYPLTTAMLSVPSVPRIHRLTASANFCSLVIVSSSASRR